MCRSKDDTDEVDNAIKKIQSLIIEEGKDNDISKKKSTSPEEKTKTIKNK